jgi:hypothetical protein
MVNSAQKLLFSVLTPLAIGALPVSAQSLVRPEDFNQFSWRWVSPTTFSGRIAAFAVPKGQSQTIYALTPSGGLNLTIQPDPLFK